MYDLLVKNGRIIDGTGSASYTADVAVAGGEIVAIGKLDGESAKTIDAAGLAVSPGFIDLHTHSDMSFLLDPTAQSKVRQGVTLELAGNCGMSFCAPLIGEAEAMLKARVSQYTDSFEVTWTDFGGYLDALERAGSTLNIATQVGHGTVRTCVIGEADRAPSGDDLEQMKALIADALDAGAMGFSTGLFYAPGNYARLDEVIDLASVAAERSKIYSTHMRDEGGRTVGQFVSLNEAIEVGRRTGVRVQSSHIKCPGAQTWGSAHMVIDVFERARAEGIDITADQYP
ncbi:MAG: amidohydrolase family protein, partial [Chloroflexi bacterium]|nr:amidohydrolase family protein [Chloroflexota bacterium]